MRFKVTYSLELEELIEATPENYPDYEGDWSDEDELHDHILDTEEDNAQDYLVNVIHNEAVGVDVTVSREDDD